MVLYLKSLVYQVIALSCDFDVVLKQGRISILVATSLNYFGNLKWRICSEIMITGIICGLTVAGQRVQIPPE